MKLIVPIEIYSVGELISSNLVDKGTVYSPLTTYALGALVRLDPAVDYMNFATDSRYYKCIQGPIKGTHPVDGDTMTGLGAALHWIDAGPTNRWAMFDSLTGTKTTRSTGITFAMEKVENTESLALMGVSGTLLTVKVTAPEHEGGLVIYTYTQTLNRYAENDVILTDLPYSRTGTLSVSVTGSASIVTVVRGNLVDLGPVEYGASLGITDYSKKVTDAYGLTTFSKRAFSKRLSVRALFNNSQLAAVYKQLAAMRATPCIWLTVDASSDPTGIFSVLSTFGYYQSFQIEVAYATQSYCSLEIEGLV